MGGFETEVLTTRKYLKSLTEVPGTWIDCVRQQHASGKPALDLNSSVRDTCGRWKRLSVTVHGVRTALTRQERRFPWRGMPAKSRFLRGWLRNTLFYRVATPWTGTSELTGHHSVTFNLRFRA